uniref:Polyketide synthase-nonribosomal peptide synthase n=1 Tax=Alternaria oxytropis TaxID=570715 RepID=A0A4P8L7Z9_9PLEO|nr:polyketide synthase-nonribosomal peptide synthase [Alternaria oxytropis]
MHSSNRTKQQEEPIAIIRVAYCFLGGANTLSKLRDLIHLPYNLSRTVPTTRFDTKSFFHPKLSHYGTTNADKAYFLDDDVSLFDAPFFNVQASKANAIDPQQRLLIEVVYKSLCNAGQRVEDIKGLNTAVYVRLMCDNWVQITGRDWDMIATYQVTSTSRAILSNCVSYFFDWHRPSITIDTACSSSLVAVHQAVAALRSGESLMAVVAGTNLILSPVMWIAESNLRMLLPTGTSKMWDAAAESYARGKGVAAVIMKPLTAAIRDGDNIECIIRATGINQDGRTSGITVPSNLAQTQLITNTYARARMDINNTKDCPQFFYAHGTGIPAGDPEEAEAISRAFFQDERTAKAPLYVGLIKTVIGHTEGTAGLASLVSTALAMKSGFIPPNLHYNTLSPSVAPFCFGGTNAHAIIEYYPTLERVNPVSTIQAVFSPINFSAASASALRQSMLDVQAYLVDHEDTNIQDLAHTLNARRSTLAFRKTLTCERVEDVVATIEEMLNGEGSDGLNTRYPDVTTPSVLGVFTGQGAEWPSMGAALIRKSPFMAARLAELDTALSSLPPTDRPDWTLRQQLTAPQSCSRLSEAAIAQPLCTAVQIVLVDLLKAADVPLRTVVGHSSGEIGAAYAAGFLSSGDALRIAYYRGFYAKQAQSPSGAKGAMMAVGTTYEDAADFCSLEEFEGRIQVAAQNSPNNVTLSGDEDVIDEALPVLQDEGRFARKLQVDTAYNSRHMFACAEQYRDALTRCDIRIRPGNDIVWLSSMLPGQSMTALLLEDLGPNYWVDNMTNSVQFAPAVMTATEDHGPFDVVIEIGPHPALKAPCLDSIRFKADQEPLYTSLLGRFKDDVTEFKKGLGFVWTHLGPKSVAFNRLESVLCSSSAPPAPLPDLPAYPFDHARSYGALTRYSGGHLIPLEAPNPLLGRRLVESETTDQISWRNILTSSEISWLQGHALQGQTVFPAMGYVAMAAEAIVAIAGPNRQLGLRDVVIGRALAFEDDRSKMETRVVVTIDSLTDEEFQGSLTCYSGLPHSSTTPLARNFSTQISATFHESHPDTLPAVRADEFNLCDTETSQFYDHFTQLGYNYSAPFTGVTSIKRRSGYATGSIEDVSGNDWEDQLLIHPGWLDCALQTCFATHSYPHDNRMWSIHVPVAIRSININPYFTTRGAGGRQKKFEYQSVVMESPSAPLVADIDVFVGDRFDEPFVQIEYVEVKPFAQSSAADDATLFTGFDYRLASPDVAAVVAGEDFYNPERLQKLQVFERVGYFYIRQMHETLTSAEKENALPHYKHFLGYAERMVSDVRKGVLPNVPPAASKDSRTYVQSLIAQYPGDVDFELLEAAGENVVSCIRQSSSVLQYFLADNLLDRFYEQSVALTYNNTLIGRIVAQIAHRHSNLRIFEVGAGTGGATSCILPALGDAFSTYTYTDISAGVFNRVQDRFQSYLNRMNFATYDVDRTPAEQGFEEHTYDVVVASNVLHATAHMDNTMANVRRLLRPGGYLIALEAITNYYLATHAIFGTLPGWWAGAEVESWRRDGPALTIDQWTALTRRHNFSGVDTHAPISSPLQAFTVLVFQAVDSVVHSLRNPLAAGLTPSAQELVVVGGLTPAVSELLGEVTELAGTYFSRVVHRTSLEELNTLGVAQGSTVLCLTELDDAFLKYRNAAKFDALKVLWRNGRNVLWVTRGARAEQPHSAMMLGLCRSIRHEYPHLNLQILDFDIMPLAKSTVEVLLQLEVTAQLKSEGREDVLWTFEPEIHVVEDQAWIPRLYPNSPANKRYNTSRRLVRQECQSRKNCRRVGSQYGQEYICPPDRVAVEASRSSCCFPIRVKIQYSMLQAIRIAEEFFYLCGARNVQTDEHVLVLTNERVTSTMDILTSWVKAMSNAQNSMIMSTMACHMIAQSIVSSNTTEEGTILVHNASEILRKSISKIAANRGIQVTFTTSRKLPAKASWDAPDIYLHERLPRRKVENLLPRDTMVFLDMSPVDNPLIDLLRKSLPPRSKTYTASDFIRAHADTSRLTDDGTATQIFEVACRTVARLSPRMSASSCLPIVSLSQVGNFKQGNEEPTIVDWTYPSHIMARVQSIDAGAIFRDDGTYWLLGMTGDMGVSICYWMVHHGARHVVLSSRNPKVHLRSFESLEVFGANIRIVSVDISNRKSLRECHNKLQADMPTIIGVANGAMVLEDSLFEEVEYDSIERAMLPKVEGSIYLDELFYSTPLDFFIFFTSVATVVGTSGQSTYVTANAFMSALAKQRRDIRGVVGSDIAIGAVQGVGYLMKDTSLGRDYFTRRGYRNLSEQDVQQLFAEAILAGKPGHQGNSQVVSGIQPFREAYKNLTANVHFQHMRLQDGDQSYGGQGDGRGSAASVRARLASVKSQTEALAVVQDAFLVRLRLILMMPKTEVIDPQISLVQLGADSIMAVDIRAWFLKELDVDILVLKILGPSESVADLVAEPVTKLSLDIDATKIGDGKEQSVANPKLVADLQANSDIRQASSSTSESVNTGLSDRSPSSSPSLKTVLETPLESLTELVDEGLELHQMEDERKSRRTTIVNSSSERSEPMTLGQKRFWVLNQYVQDPTAFNITYFAKLQGRVRVNELARAVESVAQRHESLRTRYFWSKDTNKTPMQGILSKPLLRVELSTIHHSKQAHQAFEEMQNYRWDFGDWVPLRMQLLTLSPTEHFWIVGTHHISMDAFSFSVLMLDIHKAYTTIGQHLPPLADESQIPAQGAQQRRALKSGKLRPALDFYRKVLSAIDFTKPIELFPFAKTLHRSLLAEYATHVAKVHLDASTTAKLKEVARQQRATNFHAYLAALQTLVFRLLDEDSTDQVVIGLLDANRLEKSSMESVGNLLNLLPVNFERSGDQTFAQAVQDTRDRAHAAIKHSALPFDVLLDELSIPRSAAWSPVFQIYMDYRLVVKEHAAKTWLDCKIEEETWRTARHGYDVLVEVTDSSEGATIAVHVQQALYSEKGAELLCRSYANVLKQVADKGSELNTSRMEKWNVQDVHNALTIGKGPKMPLEWPPTITGKVDEIIVSNANDIALKDAHGQTLTYRAMDERIEVIAASLESHLSGSVSKQAVVGVFQQPSIDAVCSILAIWRLGSIYVPLDLISGTPRLQSIVQVTQPDVILTDIMTSERVAEIDTTGKVATVNVSEDLRAADAYERPKRPIADPESTAYIVFTSGSTGEPKGIVIPHSGVRAYLEGLHRTWDFPNKANVVLQQSALGFDASLFQTFAALCSGGSLIIVPAEIRGDPVGITNLMIEHGVTLTHATPSDYDMWFRFAVQGLQQCKTWKAAWCGGEPSPPSILDDFRGLVDSIPGFHLFSTYGATETSIAGVEGEADVRNPAVQVPVPGRPLLNYGCYIVDTDLKPQPIDVVGEIVFAGLGVAGTTYLHRPDLTQRVFLDDDISATHENGCSRLYRTGDRGRLDEHGKITCYGRIDGDTQVKMRGFRIELTEIERVMMQEAAGLLRNAIVTLREDDARGKFIVAHVLFESTDHGTGDTPTKLIDSLMAKLRRRLPPYMCPATIIAVDSIPLGSTGKTDRKKVQNLPLPGLDSMPAAQMGNLSQTEQRLVRLWQTILPPRGSAGEIDRGTDFFLSGGNSLLLVKLQGLIRKEFNDAPRLIQLINSPELGPMASLLDVHMEKVDWDAEIEVQLEGEPKLPRGRPDVGNGLIIALTGSTGSLGQRIFQQLVSDPQVKKIICLVRIVDGRDLQNLFPFSSHKIQIEEADLPSLPPDDILSEADCILHCAADRNFWDGYHALRPINVDAAKALAHVSVRTGAALHVLSSGAVATYEDEDDARSPRPSSKDGYISTKWVTERYLKRVARHTAVPITAHRPTQARCSEGEINMQYEASVADDMILISKRLGYRPDFTNLSGTIDIARLQDVTAAIVRSITSKDCSHTAAMTVIDYPGSERISLEGLASLYNALLQHSENRSVAELPTKSVLFWIGDAKRTGLFQWFFTAQNVTMQDEHGNRVVTRR